MKIEVDDEIVIREAVKQVPLEAIFHLIATEIRERQPELERAQYWHEDKEAPAIHKLALEQLNRMEELVKLAHDTQVKMKRLSESRLRYIKKDLG